MSLFHQMAVEVDRCLRERGIPSVVKINPLTKVMLESEMRMRASFNNANTPPTASPSATTSSAAICSATGSADRRPADHHSNFTAYRKMKNRTALSSNKPRICTENTTATLPVLV